MWGVRPTRSARTWSAWPTHPGAMAGSCSAPLSCLQHLILPRLRPPPSSSIGRPFYYYHDIELIVSSSSSSQVVSPLFKTFSRRRDAIAHVEIADRMLEMRVGLTRSCFYFADNPAQVPPLTPGTNKKMTEALKASFASWEKDQINRNIPKGECAVLTHACLCSS